jgi:tetratricopeptide (TPR) repeat protein
VMPREEKKMFVNAIETSSDGINTLYQSLAKTKVENAKASEEEDRTRILKLIDDGPGFDALNAAVNECLRRWVKQIIVLEVTRRETSSASPKTDLDLARFSSVVAWILFRNDEKQQSLGLFQKSLDIYLQVHGENHEDTGTTYNNMGVVLKHLERFDDAIRMYEKAASIRESTLGKDDPNCASTYNNLGSLYCKLLDLDKGLLQFRKALDIRRRAFGENHEDVAQSYSNIGGALYQKGEYEEALKEHEKGLTIKEKCYGRDQPDTATSYENIGLVYKQQENTSMALDYLKIAYSIRTKLLGSNHSDTVKVKRLMEDLEDGLYGFNDAPLLVQAMAPPPPPVNSMYAMRPNEEPTMVQAMSPPPEATMVQAMSPPEYEYEYDDA